MSQSSWDSIWLIDVKWMEQSSIALIRKWYGYLVGLILYYGCYCSPQSLSIIHLLRSHTPCHLHAGSDLHATLSLLSHKFVVVVTAKLLVEAAMMCAVRLFCILSKTQCKPWTTMQLTSGSATCSTITGISSTASPASQIRKILQVRSRQERWNGLLLYTNSRYSDNTCEVGWTNMVQNWLFRLRLQH